MSFADATLSSVWSALGSAVVHFLWQGALIGLLAWAVLDGLRNRSSATRYAVWSGALLLCLLAFVGTFVAVLAPSKAAGGELARQVAGPSGGAAAGLAPNLGAAEIAAWCWAVGALFMALRFAVHCYWARHLRTTDVSAPDADWQRAFQSLKEQLGITGAVRLLRSGLAEVPMVVGWLSPVVLVPASAFTALSPDQLRSLLIHELAHIRRLDHLLNAVQAVVEIVLFFHPVVWWISKQMRLEREYCCDESSVRVTGNPKLLAGALASMEALRIANPTTGTVLASNGGPLMQRITRILGGRLERRSSFSGWTLPAGLVLAGFLAAAGSAYAGPAPSVDTPAAAQDRERSEPTRTQEGVDLRERYAQAEARIKAAVQAGEMTEEEAKRALDGIAARIKYAGMEARIKGAVEAGKMTEEEAKKALEGYRLRLHYASEEARVKAAVKAGEMTEKEAQRTLEALAARMKKGAERGELTPDETLQRIDAYLKGLEAGDANPRVEYAALEARLTAAVNAGEMTEGQAKQKLQELRDRMELDGVTQRIALAVKAGKLTPEQGKARLEAYKKSLAEKKTAPRGFTLEEYKAAEEKMRQAVAEGKLKAEDVERRLAEMREMIVEERKEPDPGRSHR